ncbi:MAG TPA: hypothetical protein VEY30_04630, partial [Myxococcaceae bacterium]|nr:hypothetical protein [Myxococcaceae bacterium]
MALRLVLRCCAAAWMVAGCVTTPPQTGDPAPRVSNAAQEAAYQEVLAQYTARDEVYALFDTRMFVGATYQSTAFREARVRRTALFQVLPPAEVEPRLAAERAEAEAFHDFVLGVHMNDLRYDDFGRPKSIWRVALVTGDGEITSESIQRIGRSDLNLRALYPYMGTFWVAYRVRFPVKRADGSPVISSPGAPVTLR